MLSTRRTWVTVNLNNVPDCSTCQFVAFLGVYELECGPMRLLFTLSLFPLIKQHFPLFELYELYFISVKVLKVQVKNKVYKVRTTQLC